MDSKKRPSARNRPPIQLEEGKRPPPPVATNMTAAEFAARITKHLARWEPPAPPKEAEDGL